ncbi:sugar phosphate nucleotidyltransferase [Brevibacillus borstelensis]|uniref:sugar phosphate nucleotidyltransferase n=1 Tax=Brevibacillus borstelensis TaxID=45462 RepID=UPI0030C3175A
MKGVILAGGKGTRLYPLTDVCNKHLLPVGPFPMIYYPIVKLRQAGITNILIVTGREDIGQFARLLGGGKDFGVSLTYRPQERAGGIAEALSLASDFVGTSSCIALLGDNMFEAELSPYVQRFLAGRKKAHLLLKEVDNPSRFGIAHLEGPNILKIEEKPVSPKSNFAITGIYMYRPEVFDVIAGLAPSLRGELEISDVNQYFVSTGDVSFDILTGWWEDAGTLGSYHKVNQLHHSSNLLSSSVTKPS